MKGNRNSLKQMRKSDILRRMSKYKRTDLKMMIAMFNIYKRNQVAVVENVNGELRPYEVREYVNIEISKY